MQRETNHSTNSGGAIPPYSDGERTWRRFFYVFSAAMVGYALVQASEGRLAGALGDVGVACLMLSLIPQFPFVRAIFGRAERSAGASPDRPETQLLRDLEMLRAHSPWAESVSALGWVLLGASFLLRALGVD